MCIYILIYHTLIHPYLYFIWFYEKINVLTYYFNLSFWFTPLNDFSTDCNWIHPSVREGSFKKTPIFGPQGQQGGGGLAKYQPP